MADDKEERPRRYVIGYFADNGGAENAACHLFAYTVADAVAQFGLLMGTERKYGGVRWVEPYRAEVHGDWASGYQTDIQRAQLYSVGRSREAFAPEKKKIEEPTCCWPVMKGNERRRCGATAGSAIHRDGFIGIAPHEFRADIEDEG